MLSFSRAPCCVILTGHCMRLSSSAQRLNGLPSTDALKTKLHGGGHGRKFISALVPSSLLLFLPVADGLEGAAEDRARAGAVRLADETFALHHVEDGGGAAVADAQSSLQDGGRGALHLDADSERVFKQLVAL